MNKSRLLALLAITMVAGLLVTGCNSPMGLDQNAGIAWKWSIPPKVYTLWAGQHIDAGTVTVWNANDSLYIKYDTKDGWWLEETHADVELKLELIPQANGNPIPGKFEFKNSWNPRVQTCTYTVPLRDGWDVGVCLYIATHAVVVQLDGGKVKQRQTGWAGPNKFPGKNWALYIKYCYNEGSYKDLSLPPDPVKMTVYSDHFVSHFIVLLAEVPDGYDVWNGRWRGWCAEHAVGIRPGRSYYVTLWSSYNPSLPDRCKNEHWPNVNYLLNYRPEGTTADEMQLAIWWLLTPDDPTLPPLEGKAKEMYDDALANGDGWRPTTGDWIAVICETPTGVQLVFIEVDP